MCSGLFSCPYCQERLVISKSGHYVRDPFTLRQIAISSLIRRESRPLARILRDFGILKRPAAILALGSAIIFGMTAVTLESLNEERQPSSEQSEQVTDPDPPDSPPQK